MNNSNELNRLIQELDSKDQLVKEYWFRIQSSRIKNRINKLFNRPLDIRNNYHDFKIEVQPFEKKSADIERLKYGIAERDRALGEYWEEIQRLRLKNQFKRMFGNSFKKAFELLLGLFKKVQLFFILIIKFPINTYRFYSIQRRFNRRYRAFTKSEITPFVSIIVLNRNGLSHLKRFFRYFIKNTIYDNYELIVIDNASSDDSIKYLKSIKDIPLKIIQNEENYSFSKANNEGVKMATGDFVLFLNNDTMPLTGWLYSLVKVALKEEKPGLIGSKLIYPLNFWNINSCKIQHNGIDFEEEVGFYRPVNNGTGEKPVYLDKVINETYPSVTGACMLVEKKVFLEVGGFDENYDYGYEDVDLGLKVAHSGRKNYVAGSSILFHNELGTQNTQNRDKVELRRKNNRDLFRDKWYRFLTDKIWQCKIDNTTELDLNIEPLTIAFIVTEKGDNAVAGDYFTAVELGSELSKMGYRVKYLCKHDNYYQVSKDVDVLFIMLHNYDLQQIRSANPNLIKIAWARNWFESFLNSPWVDLFDLIFSSSQKACELFLSQVQKKAYYLPLATNEDKDQVQKLQDEHFKCDYAFTGSYWEDPRDIVKYLNPENIPEYKFHLYGKNWEKIEKFKPYHKGFIKYQDITKIYINTKIVIDDANRVTKQWGSVNSRVFDAIFHDALVITNGHIGSMDIFNGKLPTYRTADELEGLIRFYLENENDRKQLVKSLKETIINHHTYSKRAAQIKNILQGFYDKSVVIKMPVPNEKEAKQWGDYHFAKSLKKELERINYRTRLDFLYNWENPHSFSFASIIVLRGLSKYVPKKFQKNIMWNISHPDKVSHDEYKLYDWVFVASDKWTKHLRQMGISNVDPLLQCTDPDIFKIPTKQERVDNELIFIGNSRGVRRKIIFDLIALNQRPSIYGSGWKQFVDPELIKEKYIPNEELYKYYGGAKIVLNDHWDDMKEKGFISNRLFDASACGAIILSDHVEGIEELFEGIVLTYFNREGLIAKLGLALNSSRPERANIREKILKLHTFAQRVEKIKEKIEKID